MYTTPKLNVCQEKSVSKIKNIEKNQFFLELTFI